MNNVDKVNAVNLLMEKNGFMMGSGPGYNPSWRRSTSPRMGDVDYSALRGGRHNKWAPKKGTLGYKMAGGDIGSKLRQTFNPYHTQQLYDNMSMWDRFKHFSSGGELGAYLRGGR